MTYYVTGYYFLYKFTFMRNTAYDSATSVSSMRKELEKYISKTELKALGIWYPELGTNCLSTCK